MTTHEATLATAVISAPEFIFGHLASCRASCSRHPGDAPQQDSDRHARWPPEAERRILVAVIAAPLLLAVLAALLLREAIVSLWSMSAMNITSGGFALIALGKVARKAAVHILALAIGFPLVMAAV